MHLSSKFGLACYEKIICICLPYRRLRKSIIEFKDIIIDSLISKILVISIPLEAIIISKIFISIPLDAGIRKYVCTFITGLISQKEKKSPPRAGRRGARMLERIRAILFMNICRCRFCVLVLRRSWIW